MIFDYIIESCNEISDYFGNDFDIKNIEFEEINIYRTHAFKLQAFGRVVKRSVKKSEIMNPHKKLIKELGTNIKMNAKFIEDSLGEYLYHYEMIHVSQDNLSLTKAREDLSKDLISYDLKISKIKEDFIALKEAVDSDIRTTYLKGLKREIKKIKESIKLIDPNLLEDGTHELRRKLRWIIMYIIYPKGLFKYIENSPKTSQYTELFPNDSYQPIQISFETMNFLSKTVFELGKLKDKGLSNNYLKPEHKINDSTEDVINYTFKVIKELIKNKYLDTLKEQISSSI